jgi:2-methylisocitrate lyase-like PEP mutase family enzyme
LQLTEDHRREKKRSMSETAMPSPDAAARFRALHAAGCFLLPNPWDVGSAILLAALGFPALATTSAGHAFTNGKPDAISGQPLDVVLAHLRLMVGATSLPVSADFQAGHADDLEILARNVEACIRTGVAGLSIEDATGDPAAPLYDRATAIARVQTARAAIDKTGIPVVLTARCEAWLVGYPDAGRVALDRLVAFADAGADCLYAPGVRDPGAIAAIVKAVAPKPVNVLMGSHVAGLTLARLADLGVRRVSLGSALARVAWGAFLHSARHIAETGTFDTLADAAPFQELNDIFVRPRD